MRCALNAAGIDVPLWSGAGSGNYFVASKLGSITEVQAGGGVLRCGLYEKFNATDLAPTMLTALFLQVKRMGPIVPCALCPVPCAL